MMEAMPKLLRQCPNAQVVILGTGKKSMEKTLERLDELSPNMAGVVKFSNPIAHYITAGADFLMVPSRFEPCGLIQLHAMQYGTVPIVASTGGLVDTVKEGVTGFHMGAMDPDALKADDVDAMVDTCAAAAAVYGTPTYSKMSSTCIGQDLSWRKPAQVGGYSRGDDVQLRLRQEEHGGDPQGDPRGAHRLGAGCPRVSGGESVRFFRTFQSTRRASDGGEAVPEKNNLFTSPCVCT